MNVVTGDPQPQARTRDHTNAINTEGSLFILVVKSPGFSHKIWTKAVQRGREKVRVQTSQGPGESEAMAQGDCLRTANGASLCAQK